MIPEMSPPITEIPDYILCNRRYNRPYTYPRPKKLAPEIPAAEYVHPNLERALLAAKRGARCKSGRWYGRMDGGDGFCVYDNGRVVERHLTVKP